MSKVKISEWMWRFLAGVMLIVVGWTVWIIYQLNPSPLIMNAAFEAAAKARANDKKNEKQSAQGVIAPPAGAEAAPKASDESPAKAADAPPAAATPPAPEAPKEPPINPDKLRFSDTIAIPVPNAKK